MFSDIFLAGHWQDLLPPSKEISIQSDLVPWALRRASGGQHRPGFEQTRTPDSSLDVSGTESLGLSLSPMKSELLMATRTPVDDMYGSPATDCTYLSVSSPVREVSSAPGSRSCSFKKSHSHRRPQDLELSVEDVSRPRTNSLPSCAARRRRRARHASGGSSPPAPCEGDHGYGGERGASDTRLCRVR